MLIRIFLFIFTIILIISLSISSFAIPNYYLSNDQKEFISAIKSNDISKIKSILASPGFSVTYVDENGDSPMMIAAREGNEEIVQLLINNDPYFPIFQNTKLETILIAAVKRNNTGIIKKILEAVINSYADITITDSDNKSALDYAEANNNQEIIILLKKAVAPQKLNEELMESSQNGDVTKTKELIKHGADVNYSPILPDGGVDAPLIEAACGGSTEVVELLITNGANIKRYGEEAIGCAAANNHINVVKLLITSGIDINQFTGTYYTTPLMASVKNGHLEMIKFLLANGADPNLGTHKWGDPLTSALDLTPPTDMEVIKILIKAGATIDDGILISAAGKQNYRAVKLLLESKVDPNIQSEDGYTALMSAAASANKEITKLLLEYKANPNLQDYRGNTALMFAVENPNNDTAKLLLEYKADPNIQNKYGETALGIAYRTNSKMIKVLIDGGAK